MEQELKELLVERLFLDVAPDAIEPDVALAEYGVDSFLLQELIVALEESFGVRFEHGDLNTDTFSTLAKLAEAVKAKQAEAEA